MNFIYIHSLWRCALSGLYWWSHYIVFRAWEESHDLNSGACTSWRHCDYICVSWFPDSPDLRRASSPLWEVAVERRKGCDSVSQEKDSACSGGDGEEVLRLQSGHMVLTRLFLDGYSRGLFLRNEHKKLKKGGWVLQLNHFLFLLCLGIPSTFQSPENRHTGWA